MDAIDFSKVVMCSLNKGRLPIGYTEVDSVTSELPRGKGTDTIIVDTQVRGINGCRVRGRFNKKYKDALMYGARNSWGGDWFGFALSSELSGGNFVFMPDGNNRFPSDTNNHFIDNNCRVRGYCFVDEKEHKLENVNVSSNSLYLFNDHCTAGSWDYSSEATIYSAEFYIDQRLVCYPVPCIRESDGAVGFWDLVNERFLTKSSGSTGILVAGKPVVNEVKSIALNGQVIWSKP